MMSQQLSRWSENKLQFISFIIELTFNCVGIGSEKIYDHIDVDFELPNLIKLSTYCNYHKSPNDIYSLSKLEHLKFNENISEINILLSLIDNVNKFTNLKINSYLWKSTEYDTFTQDIKLSNLKILDCYGYVPIRSLPTMSIYYKLVFGNEVWLR